jgi:hypothetical protein
MSTKRPCLTIVLGLAACNASPETVVSDVPVMPAPVVTTPAVARPTASADVQSVAQWHKKMHKTLLPGKGCFRASHPDPDWTEIPCGPALDVRLRPSEYAIAPVGSAITDAQGTFAAVTGVTSEYDSVTGYSDNFSLQLNTGWFSSPACSGAQSPNCKGWQQFVYENNLGNSGASVVFMQYWLISYNTDNSTCPSGWAVDGHNCVRNSSPTIWYPYLTIGDLANEALEGEVAAGGNDEVLFYHAGTYYAVGSDSVLGLASAWTAAEFNVVGAGSGSQAVFNSGTTITVKTSINDGVLASPDWFGISFTAESNNLSIVPGAICPGGGTSPYTTLAFVESNVTPAIPFCLQNQTIPPRLALF